MNNQQFELESVEPMSDVPTYREWAKETIQSYRSRPITGADLGERTNHRGWDPKIVRAFLDAEVLRPAPGEMQQRLYGI